MSAIAPIATESLQYGNGRKGPISDTCIAANVLLFDHLVGSAPKNAQLPEILKPSQNQPLYNSKDHRRRNTEHERSVRRL